MYLLRNQFHFLMLTTTFVTQEHKNHRTRTLASGAPFGPRCLGAGWGSMNLAPHHLARHFIFNTDCGQEIAALRIKVRLYHTGCSSL